MGRITFAFKINGQTTELKSAFAGLFQLGPELFLRQGGFQRPIQRHERADLDSAGFHHERLTNSTREDHIEGRPSPGLDAPAP